MLILSEECSTPLSLHYFLNEKATWSTPGLFSEGNVLANIAEIAEGSREPNLALQTLA